VFNGVSHLLKPRSVRMANCANSGWTGSGRIRPARRNWAVQKATLSSVRLRVGEAGLGEFALSQLAAARSDPRLGRKRGAMVADFWDAIEEAERVRMLGVLGLHELQHAVEREEQRLGASRDDEELSPEIAAVLQAAWERSESARAEIENGHPHLNAQALLSINSALDALVEEFVPAMRAIRVHWMVDQMFQRMQAEGSGELAGLAPDEQVARLADLTLERAQAQQPEAATQLAPEVRDQLKTAARTVLTQMMIPKLKPLRGSGTERYETILAQERLAAPGDRPIPQDLDEALIELGALRDVLVHRAGRVDSRALQQAPSLTYSDGDLARISDDAYRRYSAAVRCYAGEVIFRSIRSWPGVSDQSHGPHLTSWRNYYRAGALSRPVEIWATCAG
jgi:hypothetical protein